MRKKLEKNKNITDKEFINKILDYCVLCTLTDFSKNDPKKEFEKIAHLIILFQLSKGWKKNEHRKPNSR